jgi:hypothetical protein
MEVKIEDGKNPAFFLGEVLSWPEWQKRSACWDDEKSG